MLATRPRGLATPNPIESINVAVRELLRLEPDVQALHAVSRDNAATWQERWGMN